MSVFSNDIQVMVSDIVLGISQEMGEPITYSKRGTTPVTLYATVEDETKTLSESVSGNSKLDQEETDKIFAIPLQANFPPSTGVSITDVIVWDSRNWDVVTAKVDSVGARWKLTCVRQKMRRIGV